MADFEIPIQTNKKDHTTQVENISKEVKIYKEVCFITSVLFSLFKHSYTLPLLYNEDLAAPSSYH